MTEIDEEALLIISQVCEEWLPIMVDAVGEDLARDLPAGHPVHALWERTVVSLQLDLAGEDD